MTTYRLPEVIGGGECFVYATGYAPGCVIVEMVEGGLRIEIERSARALDAAADRAESAS